MKVKSTMSKITILLIAIPIYKIATNIYYFFRTRHLSKLHSDWIYNKCPQFPTYKSEILSLFKNAGIENVSIPTTQSLGFGQLASFYADVFTNFPNLSPDMAGAAMRMFYEAEGVYRQRIFETFSPAYWINCIIFAPKSLLTYIGFTEDKVLFKVCNVLLTFIWWFFGATSLFFLPQFKEFIIELLGKF